MFKLSKYASISALVTQRSGLTILSLCTGMPVIPLIPVPLNILNSIVSLLSFKLCATAILSAFSSFASS